MRVSKTAVCRTVRAGALPAVRAGRSHRVPERSVHEYVEETGSRLRVLGWEPSLPGGGGPDADVDVARCR
nr:helix-turn-helix domain-containing protein [Nocardiopsis sp. RV163]